MSSIYYPNSTIPILGTSTAAWMAIASSTNSSPIVMHTSSPHGLSTGDNVEVAGHTVNTAANGVWQVTAITGTIISLNGSIGNGVGTATGNVQTITVDPAFTLPSDGDLVTASSVNTFAEGAANLAPWLYLRTGKYRLADQYYCDNHGAHAPWTNWAGSPGTTPIAALNVPQALSLGIFTSIGGGFGGYVNPPGLFPTDLLDITLATESMGTFGSNYGVPAYAAQLGIGIGVNGGAASLITGSYVTLPPVIASSNYPTAETSYWPSVVMRNVYIPGGTNFERSFDIYVMGNLYNSGSGPPATTVTLTPTGLVTCIVNHYRLNTSAF